MAKVVNRVRDEDTGVGQVAVPVSIDRIDGGVNVASVNTDADGRFTYQVNGSVGLVEWTATDAGQTRTVAGDMSIQTGPVYTGEFDKLLLIFGDGVVGGGDNELAVLAPGGGGLNVDVATGLAFVKGIPYIGHTLETLAIGANASGNPRIDRVIVRVTRTGVDIYAADALVLAGTPGATPVPPALTQDATTWEISLAQIAVANGAASIIAANITDERTFAPGTTLDNSITQAKMADNAIGTAELIAGAVTNAKVTGPLDAVARTTVRKNTGADVGSRRRLNLIEGSNVTLTVADDAVDEEVDITIAASAAAGIDIRQHGGTVATDETLIDFRNPFTVTDQVDDVDIGLDIGSGAGQVAAGDHTHSTAPAHTHSEFQSFSASGFRDAATVGALNITSTTGQTVFSDTMVLSSGVTYDVYVFGGITVNAPSTDFIWAGLDITGSGTSGFLPDWVGTGTVGGERTMCVRMADRAIAGTGQTITVRMRAKVGSGTGSVGSGSFQATAIPRGSGGVA